jgi:hypothetical protein
MREPSMDSESVSTFPIGHDRVEYGSRIDDDVTHEDLLEGAAHRGNGAQQDEIAPVRGEKKTSGPAQIHSPWTRRDVKWVALGGGLRRRKDAHDDDEQRDADARVGQGSPPKTSRSSKNDTNAQ